MKKIFLMILFLCTHVHAANMCVPDMGSCTSCTDATYSGLVWSATCCGVQVSGVGVFYGRYPELGGEICILPPEQTTVSMNGVSSSVNLYTCCAMCACFMIKPYILENGVAFYPYENVDGICTITKSCSRICSERVTSVIGALF